jgi:biopolymer transport protein ExbB
MVQRLLLCLILLTGQVATAQGPEATEDAAGPSAEQPDSIPPTDSAEPNRAEQSSTPANAQRLDLLTLLKKGGPLMIPIYLMSILAITMSIERLLGLRRQKVMPQGLLDGLGQLAVVPAGFDPRRAYRLTQQYPSAASSVIRAMLLKVGRPQAELEHAVAEASQREGTRLYAHVRWLNLTAAVTPLFGLFGTVWGMIHAFFEFSRLEVGQNKADFLAEGIYVALVTTFGGLAVAIPAAILSHYFEGRIEIIMHQIDELLFNLIPQVERYEGRLRVTRQSLLDGEESDEARSARQRDAAADYKSRGAPQPISAQHDPALPGDAVVGPGGP